MSERLTIDLHSRQQAWAAIRAQLFPFLAQVLQGGHRWVLTVTRKKRSKAQNRRYWGKGVLAQIAEQAVVDGRLYSAEAWHEHLKRQILGFDELPHGQIIGKSSAGLTTVEFSDFCTAVEAYAVGELGVTFYELEP